MTRSPVLANRNRQGTPTPAPVAPGISSAQDFPSLPTPSKPSQPQATVSAPKKAVGKAAATTVKAAIPKNLPMKPIQLEEPSNEAEESKDTQDADIEDFIKEIDAGKDKMSPSVPTKQADLKQEESKQPVTDTSRAQETKKEQVKESIAIDEDNDTPNKDEAKIVKGKGKEVDTSSPADPSQPSTPTKNQSAGATPAQSTKKPKTLRLGVKAIEKDSAQPASPIPKELDRRTSTASVQQPATPSDSASFTTATVSRPSSPPPGRVGTAPVRLSKAQQKKERQARAKQAEVEKKTEEPPPAPAPEEAPVVQEPIVGRKKKTKKQKQTTTTTTDSTPAPSRPGSPERRENIVDTTEPVPPLPSSVKDAPKPEKKKEPAESSQPESSTTVPAPPPTSSQPEPSPSQSQSPQAIFASFLASGEITQHTIDSLFRPNPSMNTRLDGTADLLTAPRPTLTEAQARDLDDGRTVLISDTPATTQGNRPDNAQAGGPSTHTRHTIVLPDRRPLMGLNQGQAERMIELTSQTGIPKMPIEMETLVQLQKLKVASPNTVTTNLDGDEDSENEGEDEDEDDREVDIRRSTRNLIDDVEELLVNRFVDRTSDIESPLYAGSYNTAATALGASAAPAGNADEADSLVERFGNAIANFPGGGAGGIGQNNGLWPPPDREVPSVEEAERTVSANKRETEGIEKRLLAMMKKNRRLVMGSVQ